MPKKEKYTKRVVFYLSPSEYKKVEAALKRQPHFRNVNAYALSATLIVACKDSMQIAREQVAGVTT